MTIDISGVPEGTLVPFMWLQVEPAAQPVAQLSRMLLIGSRVDTGAEGNGSAPDNTPMILSDTSVEKLFGRSSMIAAMYRHARKISPIGEIWGISYTPDNTAIRATANIDCTNHQAKDGTATIAIGENRISIRVRAADTGSDVADKLRKAINGNEYCPFSAAADTNPNRVNLTCKWRGASGNKFLITTRWWGKESDDAGHYDITQPSGGSGGQDVTGPLAALADTEYDVIVNGWSGNAQMGSIGDFIADRWSPGNMVYGHQVVGIGDSYANLITTGSALNDPHLTILGFPGPTLSPEWCWGAELGALMQVHFSSAPEVSRPLQGLPLSGVDPTFKDVQWFTPDERQALYQAGVASVRVDAYRNVLMDREVTTYKTNVWGDLDGSWRDSNTLFQTMVFNRFMRATITGAYPRCALTDEDTGINGFVSPGQIKDTLIHAYLELESIGLVENSELFAQGLQVERDVQDANRVNLLMRPDFVNQLRIVAALVQTYLQLTDGDFPPAAA